VEDEIEKETRAECRQQKKKRRKFSLHGSSHRVIYRNAITRRLRKKK